MLALLVNVDLSHMQARGVREAIFFMDFANPWQIHQLRYKRVYRSRQFIATSAEATSNGSLVRESYL